MTIPTDEFDGSIYGTPDPIAPIVTTNTRTPVQSRPVPVQAMPIARAAGLSGPAEIVAPAPRQAPIRANAMVAGAAASGHGVLVGFSGRGTMTHAEYTTLCDTAAIPADWRMTPKTAHAQIGRIVQGLNNLGFVARADKTKAQRAIAARPNRPGYHQGALPVPTWTARYQIARTSRTGSVGGAFGEIVCTVTLTATDEVQIESSDADLAARIRTDFDSAMASSVYQAVDVSSWIASTIVERYRGARLGGNWYVRREHAERCERLLRCFAQGWGKEWLLPPLPVATSDELCQGLVKNFTAEAEIVLASYRESLDAARKRGEDRISSRAARPLWSEITTLAERAVEFSSLFSEHSGLRNLRSVLSAAANEIAESLDGMTQRFELIFDELAREAGGAR